MSVTANFIGSLQKTTHTASLTTSPTTVYTVPATNKSLTLASFAFANVNGSTKRCDLYHYDGTTSYLAWVGNIANLSTEVVTDLPIRLLPGDQIRATADTNVTLTLVLISQLETQP